MGQVSGQSWFAVIGAMAVYFVFLNVTDAPTNRPYNWRMRARPYS
jgi:hypothetical protein